MSVVRKVEGKGWVLVALLSAVMMVFGLGAYFSGSDLEAPITGSGCCNGERLGELPAWGVAYLEEVTRYMATFMFGMGLFGFLLTVVALRRRQRWAWGVLWYVPALFAIHGFALGSFPFDIGPLVLSSLGLLLMARPVLGERRAATEARRAVPVVSG